MLPLFDTFNKVLLEKEVEALDITSMQTSVITKYFPELGTTKTWDVGIQSALPLDKDDPSKGFTILDRTFQDLVFSEDAYDFDFIKTEEDGAEFYTPTNSEQEKLDQNPNYLSRFNYWLVVQCLTIKEWFSNNSEELEDFMCWEYKEHIYQQEIYFKHKLIHTYVWDRDTEPGDTRTITTGGTANSPGTSTTICNIGSGATNPTYDKDGVKLTTGKSPTFETSSGSCLKWSSLDTPFVLTVDAKSALGAVVKPNNTSLNIKVYLKSQEDSTEKIEVALGSFKDPIQLVDRYLEIVVEDPGKSDLKQIKVDFYGEEFYRIQLPFKYDEEVDLIMHDEQTLQNTDKYHPPRKLEKGVWSAPLFKTNFRLNKEFTSLKKFRQRFKENF